MNVAQLTGLIAGATALVVALAHLVTDITGTLDRFRRTPIAQQPQVAPQPGAPPAGQ